MDRMKIVAVNLPPFYFPVRENDELKMDGIASHFMNFLAHSLNRTYEYVETDENGYGIEEEPGNWTGPLGMLQRKEVDFMGAMYTIILHGFDIVEYTSAFDTVTFTVMSGPETGQKVNTPSMFSSISAELWVLLGMTFTTVSLTFWGFSKIQQKVEGRKPTSEESLLDSVLTFFGLFFQRGFSNFPPSNSHRILVTGWLFMVLIVMIDMSSYLSSQLAVVDVPERMESVDDISRFPKLIPYIPRGVIADSALEVSENADQKVVWQQVLKYDGHRDATEFFSGTIMDEISAGEAVAIGNREAFMAFMVSMDCGQFNRRFYMGSQDFLSLPIGGVMRRGLDRDFVDRINSKILEFGAMGFSRRIWLECGIPALPCLATDFSRTGEKTLTLRDVGQVFRLLGYGVAASTVVFLLEIMTVSCRICRKTS